MPTATKSKKKPTSHKKRHGHHQRRSKQFHKVYLPYLPIVVALAFSIITTGWSPRTGTLAYATELSRDALLLSTNLRRIQNGKSGLRLNDRLSQAAQTKAEDMVSRNYWSHNTPDGQEPWVFVSSTGYQYQKAGENLAYGFLTSDDTVVGWMNSPTHRANMLDGAYADVGFGFANSQNFNGAGPETVVVAMYGLPQALTGEQSVNQPAGTSPQASQPSASGYTTESEGLEPVEQQITLASTLTNGRTPWLSFVAGIIVGGALIAILIKHGLGLKRLLKDSEDFVLHHPVFDSVVVSIIIVGLTLLTTAGVIR